MEAYLKKLLQESRAAMLSSEKDGDFRHYHSFASGINGIYLTYLSMNIQLSRPLGARARRSTPQNRTYTTTQTGRFYPAQWGHILITTAATQIHG